MPTYVNSANYRDGQIKRFKPPIRNAAWGTIVLFPDGARPRSMDLKSPGLFGEQDYLGVFHECGDDAASETPPWINQITRFQKSRLTLG